MKVVILCGGFGTRIRGVADSLPKPMIPIGQYPILWHIMKYFACFGYHDFVLCLGYKGHVIKDFFLNYAQHTSDFTLELRQEGNLKFHNEHGESDWKITFADTGYSAMTGARVKKIQKYVGDECFFLTYGDGVGDVDLGELLNFHQGCQKTLTVTGVRPPGRFGEIKHNLGVVQSFNEKPQASAGLISGGFFVASPSVFDFLGDGDQLIFEREPMRHLVRERQLVVYEHSGFWQPMDTQRDHQLLNELFDDNKAPWVKW